VGLHRVSIRAFEWNKGAIRLYETLGFRHEGRGREAMWYEGKWWDDVGMGMLEGEWWELVKKRKGKDIEVNGVENGEKGGVKKTDDVKEEEE
jgi:L-amino acid N-acyltransferase YncA